MAEEQTSSLVYPERMYYELEEVRIGRRGRVTHFLVGALDPDLAEWVGPLEARYHLDNPDLPLCGRRGEFGPALAGGRNCAWCEGLLAEIDEYVCFARHSVATEMAMQTEEWNRLLAKKLGEIDMSRVGRAFSTWKTHDA